MARLFEMGIRSVLLEGGAALHAAAWDAGLIDRVQIYVTPHVLGPDGVAWQMPASFTWPPRTWPPSIAPARTRVEWVGVDCLLEGAHERHVHRAD